MATPGAAFEPDPSFWQKFGKENEGFIIRVLAALLRVAAICIFALSHWVAALILNSTLLDPAKWPKVHGLLENATMVAFVSLYAIALFDMLRAFLPKNIISKLKS